MSVTDHDTVAALAEAGAAAGRIGMQFVTGIEVTAVLDGKDVHVLGYFLNPSAPGLPDFLIAQRQERVERAREIASRLAALGVPIEIEPIIETMPVGGGRAIARPQLAKGLMEAGHVRSIAEAFDKYLGEGCPAYVPHHGATPAGAIEVIRAAGGIASIAHPGVHRRDDLLPELVAAGLDALEAFHSDHDPETTTHYLQTAQRLGLAVTGGSDYHGDGTRRAEFFGRVSLPPAHFERLTERVSATR
jgi:predicted metal-dependent phosphoesterase TrpH